MKLYLILVLIILASCTLTYRAEPELDELQKTACESADEAGSCETRLPELGIVTAEECCKSLNLCC